MLFNSFTFLMFFIIVTLIYYTINYKFRWVVLLIASYIFYMAWNPLLIIIIVFSTFVNYICGRLIYKHKNPKLLLIISLVINFGLLFVFKYLMFVNQTIGAIMAHYGYSYSFTQLYIILPMGISFYTFQGASYVIDVYRGDVKSVKNFFKFALFITYFPQLVAGPIERANRLLPQLFTKKSFSVDNIVLGVKFILVGLFKKVVIADRISQAVNNVYNSPEYHNGLSIFIATILFSFQIYLDFAGYSEIAVGCSKILNIELMENFKQPYLSKSIREFWRRWHISLSIWFKDYVYIPLGGNRVSKTRQYFNLFATFLLSGIWHGANFTFIIWGGLHGFFQIGETIISSKIKPIKKNFFVDFIRIIITFSLVSFAWIFFRANTVTDGFYLVKTMFTNVHLWFNIAYFNESINAMGIKRTELMAGLFGIIILIFTDIVANKENIHIKLDKGPFFVRFIYYTIIFVSIITLGMFYSSGQFIYFQF